MNGATRADAPQRRLDRLVRAPFAGIEPVVDLTDPDAFVAGVPHEFFARLRHQAPVYWQPTADGSGFWNVTRHDDVIAVSRDPERFSSWLGCTQIDDLEGGLLDQTRLLMLNIDPPQHTKMRLLVNRGFTPRMIGNLHAKIRAIASEIVDGVCEAGRCDVVDEIAAELPLRVIAELLGVPDADRRAIFDWTNTQIGQNDPEFQTDDADPGLASMMAMCEYASGLIAEKRAQPGDDILSALVQAEIDGERLSEAELQQFFVLLAVAGNETTRNLISHGVLALLEHPDAYRDLVADPGLLPVAVEEMLRWGTPVMHFRRTVATDTELAGHALRAGDRVVIWYASANRDEEVFQRPDVFDIRRTPNHHLAFGGRGPHFCLGAHLARLEILVMFEELMRRLPDMSFDGPVQRLRSNFISGIKHLPVVFTPSKRGT